MDHQRTLEELRQARKVDHSADGEISVLRRKVDSFKKETEMMKKQNTELKQQVDVLNNKLAHSMKASGVHDGERMSHSGSKPLLIKKDDSLQRELQMKNLEVLILVYVDCRIKTRKENFRK